MILDSSNFPLVWMHRNSSANQSMEAGLGEFNELLSRQQAFVVLNEESRDDNQHKEIGDGRKQLSLWMKENKTEIRSFIKGMIQIEPNTTKRLAAKAFAGTFAKFWGFPLFIAASKEEGLEMANKLLAGVKEEIGNRLIRNDN
ncbi:hypothetical protein [Desulfobacter curvatus]|uniref:hypothetical protein n=1 Tax=Desulfobacter curvatus TaxID=2290 RepID=UPI0003768CF9|nr:hypothetical protein [Desulfobacter curvatus]